MFLQTLTEYQGHTLSKVIIAVVVMSGVLLLFALFNRNRKQTKPNEPEILIFGEQVKRKNKKRWSKSGRRK